jgi:L-seryl-tRNA(Ser) seleniumtransferase
VEETIARVGGGALPLAELPSFACAVDESLAQPLRLHTPPVVGVVRDGRLLLDCRTLTDAEVDEVATAVSDVRA